MYDNQRSWQQRSPYNLRERPPAYENRYGRSGDFRGRGNMSPQYNYKGQVLNDRRTPPQNEYRNNLFTPTPPRRDNRTFEPFNRNEEFRKNTDGSFARNRFGNKVPTLARHYPFRGRYSNGSPTGNVRWTQEGPIRIEGNEQNENVVNRQFIEPYPVDGDQNVLAVTNPQGWPNKSWNSLSGYPPPWAIYPGYGQSQGPSNHWTGWFNKQSPQQNVITRRWFKKKRSDKDREEGRQINKINDNDSDDEGHETVRMMRREDSVDDPLQNPRHQKYLN